MTFLLPYLLFIYKPDTMNIETKKKISKSLRGKSKSASHRKAIAEAMRGLKKSIIHKSRLSKALKTYHKNNRDKSTKE